MATSGGSPAALILLVCLFVAPCYGGVTGPTVRQPFASVDMPFEADVFQPPPGYNAPQQVHITQGDHDGKAMIVSWVTPSEPGSRIVSFGTDKNDLKHQAHAEQTYYRYYNYTSGFIHHAVLKHLKHDTKYYYQIGTGDVVRQFSFTTPPAPGPDVPYTFGVIGDLGQTMNSNQTLSHYMSNPKAQALLFIGDLSYADDHPLHDNNRWDSWGRFVERSVAYQPWIWVPGNHELDYLPEYGETKPWKPFMHRYPTPYKASQSTSPLWYSIKRGPAYIIVINSYSAFGKYTPQYTWLTAEFSKVNRSETPWLMVLVHAPWYNTYNYHYLEGESMRVQFEFWLVKNKVDVVFSGHVHGYERTERISNIAYDLTNRNAAPVKDPSAPVYITIGDGGNMEGIANKFTWPQPDYSAYREASFGHAIFDIKNRTHAFYAWHRNQDGDNVIGDSQWFLNRHFNPGDV